MKLLARAGDLGELDRLVAEPALGERVHAVAFVGRAGVEHVGDQHRVVDRRDLDAAPREDGQSNLTFWPTLSTPGSSSSGFSSASASASAIWPGSELAAAEQIALAALRWPSGM